MQASFEVGPGAVLLGRKAGLRARGCDHLCGDGGFFLAQPQTGFGETWVVENRLKRGESGFGGCRRGRERMERGEVRGWASVGGGRAASAGKGED
jgi:hypothetical protein